MNHCESTRAESAYLASFAVHTGHISVIKRQPRVNRVASGPQHIQGRSMVVGETEVDHLHDANVTIVRCTRLPAHVT